MCHATGRPDIGLHAAVFAIDAPYTLRVSFGDRRARLPMKTRPPVIRLTLERTVRRLKANVRLLPRRRG